MQTLLILRIVPSVSWVFFYQKLLLGGSGATQAWLGLMRSGNTCTDDSCDSELQWMDGSEFSYDSSFMETVQFGSGDRCGRTFSFNDRRITIKGQSCSTSTKYKIICQHLCSE